MAEFEITRGEDGAWHAVNGEIAVTVGSGGEGPAQLFKRKAFKPFAPGSPRASALVAELDGVRTYLMERDGRLHVLVTKQDLNLSCP